MLMDWEAIKTFTAVAHHGTARAAAKALGVHHASIGRRLSRLESSLGAHLLERTPDGFVVTSAGERLLAAAGHFQEALYEAERHIAGQDMAASGVLTVTMAEPIATQIFAPRLPEFTAAYPGLDLHTVVSYNVLDVARRQADVAIRLDNNPPDNLIGKRLFAYHQSAYATPAYLHQHDLLADPPTARWLGWFTEPGAGAAWVKESPFPQLPLWGAFTDIRLHQAATRVGLGLGYLPCMTADADPLLIRATDQPTVPTRDIWILTHEDLRRTARVRRFMEFAEDVLRQSKKQLVGDLAQ